MRGYFCFIQSSLQRLHTAVCHIISCLLAPGKEKKKTRYDYRLVTSTAFCLDVYLAQLEGMCVKAQKTICVEGYFKTKLSFCLKRKGNDGEEKRMQRETLLQMVLLKAST